MAAPEKKTDPLTRPDDSLRCPCHSGEPLGQCCGRFLYGPDHAPSAEALMRSRYSAFALGQADYLLKTWHSTTRPEVLELDPGIVWRRLEIQSTTAGGPFDDRGTVQFAAHYRLAHQGAGAEVEGAATPRAGGEAHDAGAQPPSSAQGVRGVQSERSTFVREGGRWFYLDGDVSD